MPKRAGKVKLTNCRLLRNHAITEDDLWWSLGDGGHATIINPQMNFWSAARQNEVAADHEFDCKGLILCAGFIDLQINGAFGVDFTKLLEEKDCPFGGFREFSKKIVRGGCTSFCPTLITSTPSSYRTSIARVNNYTKALQKESHDHGCHNTPFWSGGYASSLGMHLEGPFITNKGAHPGSLLRTHDGKLEMVDEVFGPLEGVGIITMAPELGGASRVIRSLTEKGVVVSLGHSHATFDEGIAGLESGARFITHLFNAMEGFHHRDPGIIGLLGSTSHQSQFYYGLIADGIHAHPASIKIAASTHARGVVLVTDAMAAMGLDAGRYKLGDVTVDIPPCRTKAVVADTETLAGAITPIDECVRNFYAYTHCSLVEALEAATLHPARCLRIEDRKGSLDFGCDADVVLLDDSLNVKGAFINGRLVWALEGTLTHHANQANANHTASL